MILLNNLHLIGRLYLRVRVIKNSITCEKSFGASGKISFLLLIWSPMLPMTPMTM